MKVKLPIVVMVRGVQPRKRSESVVPMLVDTEIEIREMPVEAVTGRIAVADERGRRLEVVAAEGRIWCPVERSEEATVEGFEKAAVDTRAAWNSDEHLHFRSPHAEYIFGSPELRRTLSERIRTEPSEIFRSTTGDPAAEASAASLRLAGELATIGGILHSSALVPTARMKLGDYGRTIAIDRVAAMTPLQFASASSADPAMLDLDVVEGLVAAGWTLEGSLEVSGDAKRVMARIDRDPVPAMLESAVSMAADLAARYPKRNSTPFRDAVRALGAAGPDDLREAIDLVLEAPLDPDLKDNGIHVFGRDHVVHIEQAIVSLCRATRDMGPVRENAPKM